MSNSKSANSIWITPEARTSFLNVYTPRPNKLRQGALYYDFVLLFPKQQDFTGIFQIAQDLTYQVFNNANTLPRSLFPGGPKFGSNDKPVFKDGDQLADYKENYASYRGCWVLSLSSPAEKRILVQDENRQEVVDQSLFQGGDYGICAVEVSVYNHAIHGAQLSLNPKVVRKTRTGEHFGGGISTDEAVNAMDGGYVGQANPAPAPGGYVGQANPAPAPGGYVGQANPAPAPGGYVGQANPAPAPAPGGYVGQANPVPAPAPGPGSLL